MKKDDRPLQKHPPLDTSKCLSVIICVKNGEDTIGQLLESISSIAFRELIVVDGLSRDSTVDICRRYGTRVLSDEGKGLAHARQMGAENASGDIIAYIDADAQIPSPDILEKMCAEMTEKDWGAIHPQVIDPRPNKNIWEKAQDDYYRRTLNREGERRYVPCMVCLVRRELILKYRFDPAFTFGSEDVDLFHRFWKDGIKIGVSREVAHHMNRSTFGELFHQKVSYGVGDMRFIRKHGTYLSLTTPAYVLLLGTAISLKTKKPQHIIFYTIWSTALMLGMIKGLFRPG
ncbi:MAG: glycosyltransferase [Candidatus Thermoplasmatota archaeon]|nr:glycosyltransferase [Candidatus Thermoplasmatota archaeon]